MPSIPPPPTRSASFDDPVWQTWFRRLKSAAATIIDNPTVDNFVTIDANGQFQDSGYDNTSFVKVDGTQDIVMSATEEWRVGSATHYTAFEDDGFQRFEGNAQPYEDMQVSISNVKVPAANFPTERLYAHGVGGGVTFPVLGFALNNYLYFDLQTSHSMELSTVLDFHVHYTTPGDGTGKRFKFQLDVIAAEKDGTWAVPAGSPYSTEITMTGNFSTVHKFETFADIAAVNTTVSTLYKCKLTRIAATANEYASEVYVEFMDCHYIKDTNGSRSEIAK